MRKNKGLYKEILKFAKENGKYWEKKEKIESEEYICAEICERNMYEIEQNILIGKLLQDQKKLKLMLIENGVIDKIRIRNYFKFLPIINSYKVEKKYNLFKYMLEYYKNYILESYKATKVFKELKIETLSDLKINGIKVGDLIYDEYVRLNEGIYKVEKNNKILKLIKKAYALIKTNESFFRENNIKILIIQDKCYLNHGTLYRIALKNGVRVIHYLTVEKEITNETKYKHFFRVNTSIDELVKKLEKNNIKLEDVILQVKENINQRFNGNIQELDVITAYRDKRFFSKEEIYQKLSLDNKKKNAIIMCHAFSDFPHIDSSIYEDYYTWLDKLLDLIKENKQVNWLIKPHPTSYIFAEEGVVEKLLKDKNITNVKLVPNDMSTASLKEFVDVILSVRGTVGLEFALLGIPTLNAGKGSYSGHGICYEPDTEEEYKKYLDNILEISKPLSEKQIRDASILYYFIKIKNSQNFPYLVFDTNIYKNYLKKFFENIMEFRKKVGREELIKQEFLRWIKEI